MPKVKIEAKKVLDDIRAGLDEAALMEKYNLSIKGLHSVLEKLVAFKVLDESYIWTGKPARESGAPPANRELSAKEVVRDVKSGMTDGQLMRKYKLSSKGLQNLLEQLMEAGLVKDDDLEIGKPLMENTVELTADILPPVIGNASESSDVTQPISVEIEASPSPQEAAPLQPAPDRAKPQPMEAKPQEPQQAAPPQPTAPPQQKPQEVYVTDTSEAAFPSTIPITVVARSEPEAERPAPSTVSDTSPEATNKDVPANATQPAAVEPAKDLWASTEHVTLRIDDTSKDTTVPIDPPPVSQAEPAEKPQIQDFTQTLELVWKCPACGHPQHRVYEECPVCGVVAAKYLEQQKKSHEQDKKVPELKPEPRIPPIPAPEPVPSATPPAKLHKEPGPAIKPRKPAVQPLTVQEEAPAEDAAASDPLTWMLSGLAICQLVLVIVYVCVQAVFYRQQLSAVSALAWSMGGLFLMSLVIAALLHTIAVLIQLNKKILAETERSGNMLKTIIAKAHKRPE